MNEPVSFISGTVGKCLGNPLLDNPPYMPGETYIEFRDGRQMPITDLLHFWWFSKPSALTGIWLCVCVGVLLY